jgi:hypothetical protein
LIDKKDLITKVSTAWAAVLGMDVDEVPLDRGFVETSGTSLRLIMLWERLRPLTERPLRLSDLLRHNTVRAQAALLAGEDRKLPAAVPATDLRVLLGGGGKR